MNNRAEEGQNGSNPEYFDLLVYAATMATCFIIAYLINNFKPKKQASNPINNLKRQLGKAKTNSDRLSLVGFPDEMVPSEFCCQISTQIMDIPIKLSRTNQVYDWPFLYGWLSDSQGIKEYRLTDDNEPTYKFRNPGNNVTISFPNDIENQIDLREKIDLFVQTIIDQVILLRQIRSHSYCALFPLATSLSADDYNVIKNQAMRAVEQSGLTPSLTLRR